MEVSHEQVADHADSAAFTGSTEVALTALIAVVDAESSRPGPGRGGTPGTLRPARSRAKSSTPRSTRREAPRSPLVEATDRNGPEVQDPTSNRASTCRSGFRRAITRSPPRRTSLSDSRRAADRRWTQEVNLSLRAGGGRRGHVGRRAEEGGSQRRRDPWGLRGGGAQPTRASTTKRSPSSTKCVAQVPKCVECYNNIASSSARKKD